MLTWLKFSFLLEVEPSGHEIVLKATYRERIIPTEQVQTVLKQLDALVRNFVENPDRQVRDLTTGMDHSLLSIENPKPQLVDPSSTRTLATLFEDAAAKYPENIALEMFHNISAGSTDSTEVTYSELNAMANQLARQLVEIGVVRDELVVICLEKSVKCYVGILAIVKAGAGYLPLTPDTPKERIRQIVASAEVKVFLATSSVIRRIGPHGPLENVTFVDVDTVDADHHEEKDMRLSIPARNVAYAVFTSGSTGVPKGVLVEHEQAVGNFDVLGELYPTKAGDRFLQFCSIAFDGRYLTARDKGMLLMFSSFGLRDLLHMEPWHDPLLRNQGCSSPRPRDRSQRDGSLASQHDPHRCCSYQPRQRSCCEIPRHVRRSSD